MGFPNIAIKKLFLMFDVVAATKLSDIGAMWHARGLRGLSGRLPTAQSGAESPRKAMGPHIQITGRRGPVASGFRGGRTGK